MEQSKEFTLQVLGAHVVELAAARVRNAQLEQRIAELTSKPEPDEPTEAV